jgi:hypothetical protein
MKATVLAPIACCSPIHEAATVDDLHLMLGLTLKRKATWLTILWAAEMFYYCYRFDELWRNCLDDDNCRLSAFATINVALHSVLFLLAWMTLLDFTQVSCIFMATFAALCSVQALFTVGLASLTSYFRFMNTGDWTPYMIAFLTLEGTLSLYYVIYVVFYARSAAALWAIEIRDAALAAAKEDGQPINPSKPRHYII